MRLLRLTLLSTAALAAPLHAAPRFSFTGSTVNAGLRASFTVSRTGGTGSTSLTFQTVNGTAASGTDYVATTQILNFGRTQPKSITVYVSTTATNVAGPLAFTAKISGRYVPLLTATATIIEAAPPPSPPPPPTTQTCPDGSVIPLSSTCPLPPPPPATQPPGYVASPSLTGAAPIASNFDYNLAILASVLPSPSTAPEPGAFRFICGPSQLLYDDPIVKPGQPGASHLHQFYGNNSANANSTFTSLRAAGTSSCNNGTYAANRSGYWIPAMFDGKGNVVQPDYVAVYYKREPLSDPACALSGAPPAEGHCVGIPNAIRFVFGWDPTGINAAPTGSAYFNCQGPTAVPGHYLTIAAVAAYCPAGQGNQFGFIIEAPNCWNGQYLDSPDHRSHVGYPSYGDWGYLKCDAAHPYVIPTFTLGTWYSVNTGDDLTLWDFSSAMMAPGQPHGFTAHADYFEAWDNTVKSMWQDNCIDKRLNCSAGDLGNGFRLINAGQPTYGVINPNHLVPIPPHP